MTTERAPTIERWLWITGFVGWYEVSNHGRVRSSRQGRIKPVQCWVDKRGYWHVTLDGRQRKVHHLVLEAFVEPRPHPRSETRHLDGDPGHNWPGNLAWGTRLDNAADKRRHGTHNNTRRLTCRRAGHVLVEPNLDLYFAGQGKRCCRSCRWASTIASQARRHGRVQDRDALAAEMYAHLMEGGPDPRDRNLTGVLAA